MKQYEIPINRLTALYRILPGARDRRLLDIGWHGRKMDIGCGWYDSGATTISLYTDKNCSPQPCKNCQKNTHTHISLTDMKSLNSIGHSYDLIVLHGTFDAGNHPQCKSDNNANTQALINQCAKMLSKNGILAGCFENRYGVNAIKNIWRQPLPPLTRISIQNQLTTAGFEKPAICALQYDIFSPENLVGLDYQSFYIHQNHNLLAIKGSRSSFYWHLKNLWIASGLNRYLANYYFFWAVKACWR